MAKRKAIPKRPDFVALRVTEEDWKLLNILRARFGTRGNGDTIREAMLLAGENLGVDIERGTGGKGYRVEL